MRTTYRQLPTFSPVFKMPCKSPFFFISYHQPPLFAAQWPDNLATIRSSGAPGGPLPGNYSTSLGLTGTNTRTISRFLGLYIQICPYTRTCSRSSKKLRMLPCCDLRTRSDLLIHMDGSLSMTRAYCLPSNPRDRLQMARVDTLVKSLAMQQHCWREHP